MYLTNAYLNLFKKPKIRPSRENKQKKERQLQS
jgi:hypothetical protein